jgi:hypothetical protein
VSDGMDDTCHLLQVGRTRDTMPLIETQKSSRRPSGWCACRRRGDAIDDEGCDANVEARAAKAVGWNMLCAHC